MTQIGGSANLHYATKLLVGEVTELILARINVDESSLLLEACFAYRDVFVVVSLALVPLVSNEVFEESASVKTWWIAKLLGASTIIGVYRAM